MNSVSLNDKKVLKLCKDLESEQIERTISQVELKENENPQAVFEFDKPGTFGVIVKDALFEAESKEETRDKIIQLILTDKNITAKKLANKIGITEKGVEYHLSKLKTDKVLKRRKGRKGGYWEIINNL